MVCNGFLHSFRAMLHESVYYSENEYASISLRKDGIVHVNFKSYTQITIEVQEVMVKAYWEVASKERLFIFEGGEFVSITKEARDNAILIEDQSPVLASAIIVSNLAHKIIADYYYKVNKPQKPFRVFKNFNQGILWLNELSH